MFVLPSSVAAVWSSDADSGSESLTIDSICCDLLDISREYQDLFKEFSKKMHGLVLNGDSRAFIYTWNEVFSI